ncbi:hypothetical protein LC613_31675 [Nostoc sphaeroides CHAB 2801]|uniref:hypothetical protein n=1 Tax=Nostoc sphaeroides TaxID=446679 RepID=UPI001E5F5AC4|nr:hypothetical protein [Nostoc sphaeroides]MCC5632213.1 hypothetical protein [Nostoc sphaeroides CHAB 2801]
MGNNAQNRCKSYSTQSNPASLFENQDCGDEVKGCHEGTCFAAPVAQNEKSSKEAISLIKHRRKQKQVIPLRCWLKTRFRLEKSKQFKIQNYQFHYYNQWGLETRH